MRRPPAAMLAIVTALVASLMAAPAWAGRNCEARPPTPASVAQAMSLAERTAAALDRSGARVVVLGRVGQDLSRYGVHWSHLALAYRAAPGEPWRLVHKLNQCGTAQSSIYRQGLGDFFLDDLWRYEAGFVVLAPELQDRLLAALADNARLTAVDTPAYSMVAYAWATRYQQSNQWAIETLAAFADADVRDRARAQAWLQARDYRPAVLRLNTFERLGARVTAGNVAFDDHPNEKRFAGRIETVTVDSVFEWLARSGLGSRVEVVR